MSKIGGAWPRAGLPLRAYIHVNARKNSYDRMVIACIFGRAQRRWARDGRLPPRLIKVDNIITRTSHYDSFAVSGTGYTLNGRLARGRRRQARCLAQGLAPPAQQLHLGGGEESTLYYNGLSYNPPYNPPT